MRNTILPVGCISVLCGFLFIFSGCMERRERWAVDIDGSVKAQLEFSTESEAELYDGDAVPSIMRGWFVEETQHPGEEGKVEIRLSATREFAPDAPLPDHYGEGLLENPDVYLHFPTTLTIEQRRDGTYYHFKRTYLSRPWASWARIRDAVTAQFPEYADQPFEGLSEAQKSEVIRSIARMETARFETIAWQAYLDVADDAPQDVWLSIRDAMRAAAEDRDYEAIARLFGSTEIPLDERGLQQEAEQFEDDVLLAIKDALHNSPFLGSARYAAFTERFNWHRRFHEITEDLQDENFDIEVAMPGQIVGHNGDSARSNVIHWRFSGDMFFDRDHELMVTSVVR